jgi:transposase InsO family protein
MLELARAHPRYGYRMITAKLRQEGWQVNRKRIYRLWRREGLKVPQKKRKRRRLGRSCNACHRRRAALMNDVWCWDFIFDRTTALAIIESELPVEALGQGMAKPAEPWRMPHEWMHRFVTRCDTL